MRYELPNPVALRETAQRAIVVGSAAVAFPVGDVLKLADQIGQALLALAAMKAIIDTQSITGRVVVSIGGQIIELAEAGKADELAEIFEPFRSALKALDDALPEAAEDEAPGAPLSN